MFYCTNDFNQPINKWDISNVANMSYLFCEADDLNQSLDNYILLLLSSDLNL